MFSKQINFSEDVMRRLPTFPSSFWRAVDWFRYRTTRKYHTINIPTLKPGYYDIDTRLLHGMFSLLVDFVEIECAWMTLLCRSDLKPTSFVKSSIIQKIKRKFVPFRSKELGLQHLDWEMSLQEDEQGQSGGWSQAAAAKEIKTLYLWWKEDYLNRKEPEEYLEPEEYQEWRNWLHSHYFEKQENGNSLMKTKCTEEEDERGHNLNRRIFSIEEDLHKEDENMMVRLVKLHRCLWT